MREPSTQVIRQQSGNFGSGWREALDVLRRPPPAGYARDLAEISRSVDPGAHAVLMVEGAGWHSVQDLIVPVNISLLTLPPYASELDRWRTSGRASREDWLSERIFGSYDNIVDRCCEAWNRLIDQPWKIMSIGLRDWAYRS